jgi:small subunit ribosomal protein S19e|tara:strand:- start:111 stop:674 length:564 start_codon:yes stop_codon:yes gene_type:complete
MGNIYNADPSELIEKAGEELKKVESIKAPDWAVFVKTGMHKERPPANHDWWYVRAASILRKMYVSGPVGVSKLRTKYGGMKNRGVKPGSFYKGSGSIIRKIIQQLEKEDFVKKDLKSIHKGRLITAKGKKFLDEIAAKISKVTVEKAPEAKKEVKAEEKAKEKKTEQKETKPEQKPAETDNKKVPKK